MNTVCFTGRGSNARGVFVERGQLIQMAEAAGWQVHDKVYQSTDFLVASRTDTSKAAKAAALGTRVLEYSEFWHMIASGQVSKAFEPPVNTTPIDYEAMEKLEGWGLF